MDECDQAKFQLKKTEHQYFVIQKRKQKSADLNALLFCDESKNL